MCLLTLEAGLGHSTRTGASKLSLFILPMHTFLEISVTWW